MLPTITGVEPVRQPLYTFAYLLIVSVIEASLSQTSNVYVPSPVRQRASPNQSPEHLAATSSPVHHPTPTPPAAAIAPVFSASSPARQRSSITPDTAHRLPLTPDPARCPIMPGCETTIEIDKGKSGLGLSIVGGSDTLLVCIYLCFILHIYALSCIDIINTSSSMPT